MCAAIARRDLLVGALASAACSRKRAFEPPPPLAAPAVSAPPALGLVAASTRGMMRALTWRFDEGAAPGACVVLVPTWGRPGERFPVVVALHGRGEALKGANDGAWGWPRDYALTRAIERACAPPITADDMQGIVEGGSLEAVNRALEERPFQGLVIVCPYVPDLDVRSAAQARDYGRFVVERLLPRVVDETPALAGAASTGIDGVSLGGAMALRVGLANPAAFGAVGALQPALAEDQATEYTELARAAEARRPSLALRLTTSHDDVYRTAITRVGEAMQAGGVAVERHELPGPHDYPFNRGPGAYELLLWHDRVLARASDAGGAPPR